jgi:hypothetical protein
MCRYDVMECRFYIQINLSFNKRQAVGIVQFYTQKDVLLFF